MAEPTTTTTTAAAVATVASGVAINQVLPALDINAAFGAVVGAALVASTKRDLPGIKRLTSFLFSVVCGYFGASEFIARGWAEQTFLPALLGALVIVPIALRLIAMAPDFDPLRLLGIFRGGAK